MTVGVVLAISSVFWCGNFVSFACCGVNLCVVLCVGVVWVLCGFCVVWRKTNTYLFF